MKDMVGMTWKNNLASISSHSFYIFYDCVGLWTKAMKGKQQNFLLQFLITTNISLWEHILRVGFGSYLSPCVVLLKEFE